MSNPIPVPGRSPGADKVNTIKFALRVLQSAGPPLEIADIALHVVGAVGPTALIYADVLERRTLERCTKSSSSEIPALSLRYVNRSKLYIGLSRLLHCDAADPTAGMAALEAACQGNGIRDGPLWRVVDILFKSAQQKQHQQELGEAAAKHCSASGMSQHHTDLWQEFWQCYRKKHQAKVNVASSISASPMASRQYTSETASRNPTPMSARPATSSSTIPKLPAQPHSARDVYKLRMPSVCKRFNALEEIRSKRADAGSRQRKPMGFPVAQGGASRPASRGAVCSPIYMKIQQEFDSFEELAQQKELAMRPAEVERESSSESEEDKDAAMKKARRLLAASQRSSARLGVEDSPQSDRMEMKSFTSAKDDGESSGSANDDATLSSRSSQARRSARKTNGRISFSDKSRRQRQPIYCFSGFDDYKKHAMVPGRGIDKNTREVLMVEATEPCWNWECAMVEHKRLRTRRLRDEPKDSRSRPTSRGVAWHSDGLDTTPVASCRSSNPAGKAFFLPNTPTATFQRAWSREGMAPTEGGADAENLDDASGLEPLQRYAHVCAASGVTPQASSIRFIIERPPALNLRGESYSDEDILALAAALPYGGQIEAVDLGENSRLTDSSVVAILRALAKRHVEVVSLRLDRCSKLGTEAVEYCTRLIKGKLRDLSLLDLSGIAIGVQEYIDLAGAIEIHPYLREVRLAATALGRASKTQTAKVCASLIGNPGLRSLDLAWNSLDAMALDALGRGLMEHGCLQMLSLANTGTSFEGGESPMLAFLERLSSDTTLTDLDISNNGLDGRAALVLESATRHHPKLECVRISDNPLGIDGMRSLLRLLANPDCGSFTQLFARNCKGTPISQEFNGPFDGDPSGRYQINLRLASHRALLRLLLMRLTEGTAGAVSLSSVVKNCLIQRETSQVAFNIDNLKKRMGCWEVPASGEMTFDLNAEDVVLMPAKESSSAVDVVENILKDCRISLVNERKMFAVLAYARSVEDHSAQETVLAALSRDFILTVEQLIALCRSDLTTPSCGKDPAGSCSRLLPCILGPINVRPAICCTSSLEELMRVEQGAKWLLNLNLENPSGHYELDLSQPADRSIAERLLLLNRWQFRVWRKKDHVDISEFGNSKNFRNEMFNGRPFRWTTGDWRVPSGSRCVLSFDYISLSRPPKNAQTVTDEQWRRILGYLKDDIHVDTRPHGRKICEETQPRGSKARAQDTHAHARALGSKQRTQSHAFTAANSSGADSITNSRSIRGGGSKRGTSHEPTVDKPAMSEKDVLWALRAWSSQVWIKTQHLRELLNMFWEQDARVECLVYFILRCVDWPLNGKLCRPKFNRQLWTEVKNRVGLLTLFVFMQPENTLFQLDLSIPEQRRMLHAVIKLMQAEHPSNLKKPRIDWRGPSESPKWDSFVSGIPMSWEIYGSIPTAGLFEGLYMCSMENSRLPMRRRLAGKDIGGWHLPEGLELARAVHWWCVLDEVPAEVVRVLVFIVWRWSSLGEAFPALDINGDGKLNHKEFTASLLDAGFGSTSGHKKHKDKDHHDGDDKGKNWKAKANGLSAAQRAAEPSASGGSHKKLHEKTREELLEALTVVYRWLDSSNDGDISQKEFFILLGIWRELWLSMWEFKNFLIQCHGDLSSAWDAADLDHGGFLDISELESVATYERCTFMGPLHQIFMYLDKDGDDKIEKHEWMELEGIGTSVKQPAW